MELGRIWNLATVAVSDDRFAILGRLGEEEEEEVLGLVDSDSEEEDQGTVKGQSGVPPPPAPLGSGLGRATFKRGLGERMPRVRKWSKPNQKLYFSGEWGICNDNCDCHSGGS